MTGFVTTVGKMKYTYCSKGKYWYFRRDDITHRLAGQPGSADFNRDYLRILEQSEKIRALEVGRRISARMKSRRIRMRRADTLLQGKVYFIGGKSGPIKIGFTRDIEQRLQRIQMHSPVSVSVLHYFHGTPRDELILHRKFEHIRQHGEWFSRRDDLLACIRQLRTLSDAEQQAILRNDEEEGCGKSAVLHLSC
ncbi:hypothetical protein M2336_001719 [Sphingobium sp. B1D7B]|uniref:GIY-YIG nuclease family protein n=1 Tax=Sphingobium sp. B1D7B TaxID=2940578 RepID=UPI0022259174|nr:GIY-YIG nuclease family protein [Sphingobium sp. B1D7B]MCW2405090.1 hypothetical protein [Sphingobium sp. B1D7B]